MADKEHKFYEDVLGLICGSLLVSLGLVLLSENSLLSPGTAGLAMALDTLLPLNFGQIFFVINIPFYYLSWRQMGWSFTLKTFISVTLVAIMTQVFPMLVQFNHTSIVFSSVVGGILIGLGVLAMFRHKSSLGGIGILAFYLQNRYSISAGKFQMAADITIVCSSYFLTNITGLVFSVLAAFLLNLVIAVNHKEGRYIVT
ncbi:YitT family protein [uncultured Paraglaciecola sp.]|uniref:YitT family protein n=1 Tax=uncultured Paraglaciecola sp. TaxID=1765024 RepID=UPI0025968A70|nr:YitT family protein [uncultured Paraglaciecola sp.]